MNTFGRIYRLTDFGDTHGPAMGGIIDGCPAGLEMDTGFISKELRRRSPSSHPHSTRRSEDDTVIFLSGINENLTTGGPIGFIVENKKPQERSDYADIMKPSHASYTYKMKYGARSNEDCGRASARQTVNRVVAGAVAKLILKKYGITIEAFTTDTMQIPEGDTLGAKVACTIKNLPAGLGEPVYDKFHARLGYAMLSINAAKGFEIGEGFRAARMTGSEFNDRQREDFTFTSNHDGGVQGGITNGQDLFFSVAFKPIPTIRQEQQTIDFCGRPVSYTGNLRNDLCVAPRVIPVVEAMAAMTVVDFLLISKTIAHEI